jgi:hypothetical protein
VRLVAGHRMAEIGPPRAKKQSGGNMFKKHTLVQWVSFLVVLAMVVALLWFAGYLQKASF